VNPSDGETLLRFEDSTVSIPKERRLRRILLELTSRCNLDCPMCFLKSSGEIRGDLEWKVLENLFEQTKRFPNLEWVHFGGVGEPLVHPRALEALQLAVGKGWSVRLTTNGTLVDSSMARALTRIGLKAVDFSLEPEGVGRPGRDSDGGSILKAMRILDQAKKAEGSVSPEIRAAIVLTASNLERVLTLPKALREAGVRAVSLSNLVPATEEMRPLVLYPVSLEEEAVLQKELFLAFQKEGLNVALPRFALSSERHCVFARSEMLFVRWDGKVSPCIRLSHGYDEWVLGRKKRVCPHFFGSLSDESLEEIWDSPAYASFRWRLRRALYASCLDCNLLPVCEYPKTTESDCWGDSPACSDCLWDRNLIRCP
jgi:tungsten cofactor oxidoreducase radical SAM maturase